MFSRNLARLAVLAAGLLPMLAVGAAPGKYTLVQLPENGQGGRPRRVYAVKPGHHVVVGDVSADGKFGPTTWSSFSGSEWFAEVYTALTPGGGGTVHAAAFTKSVADGCLIGEAQDGGGTNHAVLWRGGLPETPPVNLLPFAEQSVALDVVRLPTATGSPADRFGVVGSMTIEGGATRGFYALPEVEDEVLVLFIGQLPTLGGLSCQATGIARTPGGVRIVGRAQNAQGSWKACQWEGPADGIGAAATKGVRARANAVEFGLITALTAPGDGTVHAIDPSAAFAVGAAVNSGGISAPIAWQANAQGVFVPLALKAPTGLVEGAAWGVDQTARAVGYVTVRRKGKLRVTGFLCTPHLGPKLINLDDRIKSGQGIFRNDFVTKQPTGIAGDGAICGAGTRKGLGDAVFPFILIPPS